MLKNKELKLLILFLLALSAYQIINLNSNYSEGDDFAQYISQSKVFFDTSYDEYLVQTKLNSYSSVQIGPNAYPIGYPAVLKISELFSNGKFKYYKIVNILFFDIYVLLTFLIIAKRSKILALIVSGLIIFSQEIYALSVSIESDLMFSVFCLFGVHYLEKKQSYGIPLIVAFIGILIKVQSLIFILVITFFLYRKKVLNKYRMIYFYFSLLYLIIYISKYSFIFGEYKDHLSQFSPFFLNFKYNLVTISEAFLPSRLENTFFTSFISCLLLYVTIRTLWNVKNIDIHGLLFLGFLSFFSMYLNQQGIRFLVILLPSLFILFYDIFKFRIFKVSLLTLFLALILVLNFNSPLSYQQSDLAFNKNNRELFSYVEKNVAIDEYIAIDKPRLLRMATSRNAIYLDEKSLLSSPIFVILNKQDLTKTFSLQKKYVLMETFGKYKVFKIVDKDYLDK